MPTPAKMVTLFRVAERARITVDEVETAFLKRFDQVLESSTDDQIDLVIVMIQNILDCGSLLIAAANKLAGSAPAAVAPVSTPKAPAPQVTVPVRPHIPRLPPRRLCRPKQPEPQQPAVNQLDLMTHVDGTASSTVPAAEPEAHVSNEVSEYAAAPIEEEAPVLDGPLVKSSPLEEPMATAVVSAAPRSRPPPRPRPSFLDDEPDEED